MKPIKNFYTIHSIFIALMVASLISGFVFLATNTLDFIIEALNQSKFSFSNAAYSFSKIVGGIALPLVFIIPSQRELGRIKSARFVLILYGVLHIITLTWILAFFAKGATDMVEFQSSTENSYVASYVLWDTYSWAGSIYSFLYGLLCIYTGISIDDNKKKVCICVLTMLLFRILAPIITNLVTGNDILSAFWITNNYADILSLLAFTIAMFVASIHDITWVNIIWDEEIETGADEDIV